ncbi:MAG: tail fiber domain-containing protein [Akkermansiaceae bacterium]|nr:tail fiber domain-containing protein [Akkermansiaceae bacterium]
MKKYTLLAATLLAFTTLSPAQTSAVPNFISYQGRVLDASGNNVGTGTPVNRTVIFRIWDNPTSTNAANLKYSEAQTVTVSEGEFSVLVGQGVANPTQTFGYSETAKKLADLATAFDGNTRFLGVTVAATGTIATTDNEITPRQQIVSTAFAMRSKFAESIGTSSDLTLNPLSGTASNYGLGWYGTGRLFGGTAVDGPVLYGNAGGALGSNVSGTQKTALRWDASGRVGIGATAISSTTNKLTLQGDMTTSPADQLTIRGDADNNKRLLLGYDTTANKASLQSYTAASTTGMLLLNPSGGNVGINKTAPGVALDVTGAIAASGSITGSSFSGSSFTGNGSGLTGVAKLTSENNFALPQTFTDNDAATPQLFKIVRNPGNLAGWGTPGTLSLSCDRFGIKGSGADGDAVIRSDRSIIISSFPLTTNNPPAWGIVVATNNNVGIGRKDPSFKLDVNGSLRCVGAVNTSSDVRYKQDIRPVSGALETITALRGVSYDWNRAGFPDKDFPKDRSIGFIGQEIEKVLPSVVHKDAEGFYSVAYSEVIPVLVEATKQLNDRQETGIRALREENSALRERIATLEAKDAARDAKMAAIEKLLSSPDQPATRTVSLETAE